MASPASAPLRLDVYLVELDPTVGSEIQKTRPCVVVSPDEANRYLATVIVSPMTTGGVIIQRGLRAVSKTEMVMWHWIILAPLTRRAYLGG